MLHDARQRHTAILATRLAGFHQFVGLSDFRETKYADRLHSAVARVHAHGNPRQKIALPFGNALSAKALKKLPITATDASLDTTIEQPDL